MATFSLTDLKNAVDKKYAPTIVENGSDTYTLQNLLQLSEKDREAVLDLLDQLTAKKDPDEDGESSDRLDVSAELEAFSSVIRLVEVNGRGQDLLDLFGDNPAVLLELGTVWMNGSELGEAVPS